MFAVFRFDAGVKVPPVIQLKTANICYDLHRFQQLPPDQHRTMTQSRRIHIWGRDETVQLFHGIVIIYDCLLYTSPSPRDLSTSRMPSSA